MQSKLARFLPAYRNTPHQSTGVSPVMLLMSRPLRSMLDLLRPQAPASVSTAPPSSQFAVGQTVLTRDFHPGQKWVTGIIEKQIGTYLYQVYVGDVLHKRHFDQLHPLPDSAPCIRRQQESLPPLAELLPPPPSFQSPIQPDPPPSAALPSAPDAATVPTDESSVLAISTAVPVLLPEPEPEATVTPSVSSPPPTTPAPLVPTSVRPKRATKLSCRLGPEFVISCPSKGGRSVVTDNPSGNT